MSRHVLFVLGTRPEAIKLAPLIAECRRRPRLTTRVCLTGQHRELLRPLVEWFDLRPDVDLALMQPDQTPAALVSRAIAALDTLFQQEQPDLIVVQGDTSTVLAASLAAYLARRRVLHVEAGLRTGDLDAPWPEEFNRRVTTLATTLHAAPTERAADALRREGVPAERIRVTGNTVVDALLQTVTRVEQEAAAGRRAPAWTGERRVVLITGHRRESLQGGLAQVADAVRQLAERFTSVDFVWAEHPNPTVRAVLDAALVGASNVRRIAPPEYPDFVALMRRSSFIISDSGGIQEEAPSLGRRVLVTRAVTERPEGVVSGWIELVGVEPARIFERAAALLGESPSVAVPMGDNPYGDGRAAGRIVEWMEDYLIGS